MCKQSENVGKLPLSKILNYYILNVGGVGGIVKALLAFVASIMLLWEAEIDVLLFNLLLLNVPYLIDCVGTKCIPENVVSESFMRIRTGTIIALGGSIAFSFITLGVGINVELSDANWLGIVAKVCNFFGVAGIIVDYTSGIYMKEERKRQIDQNNQQ